jgi:superfamily II DNA or RNA helicase
MVRAPEPPSPLRPYQADAAIKGAARIRASGGFYVQHPPGAGKSLTAIAIARLLKAESIVIVCPLVAIGVWYREIAQWWPGRKFNPTVVNYDKLLDKKELARLCDMMPDLLIVDEGQYVKSITAGRTKAVAKLASSSAGVLYLSGTPAHSPIDWWAQYRVIARGVPAFSMNFSTYKQQLVVMGGPNNNWPMKDKKTGQLRVRPEAYRKIVQAMEPYTHTAMDALADLETPVEQEISFDLSAPERRVYDDMAQYLRAELDADTEANAEIVLTKLLRLTQIAAGHVTDNKGKTYEVGHSREHALADLLEQHADEKVVIATRFKEDVRRLREWISKTRPVEFIDGSVSGSHRTVVEDWFQTVNAPAVMILQYQAGGVAITLHAAKTLILYTLDPSVIRYRQMIGRIWRIGQKGLCRIYTLTANDTQDSLMLGGLQKGYEQVDLARVLLTHLKAG